MKFCIISPTAGLEKFATKSKTHLVLAHVFVEDAQYREFYLDRKRQGDFIMLDNGAYEGQFDSRALRAVLAQLRPDVCVLPDMVMGQSTASYQLGLEFYRRWNDKFPEINWLYIPHGVDIFDWCNGLALFSNYYSEGLRWIGIPRCLATDISPEEYIRVDAAKSIVRRWPVINIHCMGMVDGDIDELVELKEIPQVRTIDSSSPVWRAWSDLPTPIDFSSPLPTDEATLTAIENRLEAVLGHCE